MKQCCLSLLVGCALLCGSAPALAESPAPAPPGAQATIASLDIPRYMGTWYEIAKFPNWFQRKCTGATSAEYRLEGDGQVLVTNRCRIASGEMIEAVGLARQIGPTSSAKLQVRFAPAWLSWLPFVWGNYWVIDLDDNYQLAAVSEPSREYLWILARTPTISRQDYDSLLARLVQQGFDLTRLEPSRQD